MKKILSVFLAIILALSVVGCSAGKDKKVYNLRSSTNLTATSTVGKSLAHFVELVNEKSNGRINATANFGSELGSQAEQVEMAKLGDLDMVVAAPGTGPGSYEGLGQLMMFEFPFLFKDNDHYRRVLKEMEGDVDKLVSSIGFTAMAGQSQGSRYILTTSPVNSMEDMKGLVMRGPNKVYISMFEALGASGITMDWNEIYTALSQKICNGCEGSPSSLNASKFQDNAKYLAVTNHIIACVYYFFNSEWLEELPEDLQKIVRECADEAVAYQEKIDDEDQTVALEQMKKDGVTVTEMADIDAWKAACAPMLDEYRSKGQEWSSFIDKLTAVQ